MGGLIDEGDGIATMLFTRRFADCNNQTALPANGADAISPASCANVYAASFQVSWGSSTLDASSSRSKHVQEASALAAREEWKSELRARLGALEAETRELLRLLDDGQVRDASSRAMYL